MKSFCSRRWTCTTTMSQTQTATVALATTVSHHQLNLLFCIFTLPLASLLIHLFFTLYLRCTDSHSFHKCLCVTSLHQSQTHPSFFFIITIVYFHYQSRITFHHYFSFSFFSCLLFPNLIAWGAK